MPALLKEMTVNSRDMNADFLKDSNWGNKYSSKYTELTFITAVPIPCRWYRSNFYKATAEKHCAAEKEIREAVLFARHRAGWSTHLNGSLYDREKFKKEQHYIGEYMPAQAC